MASVFYGKSDTLLLARSCFSLQENKELLFNGELSDLQIYSLNHISSF